MNEELKKIEKMYGEGMVQLCSKHFPVLIEKGVLFDILKSNFQENKYLSEDIIKNGIEDDFRSYINSKTKEEYIEKIPVDKTPTELMNMAGYKLFECKTEEDIQLFKPYYAKGEKLCTFGGRRLESSHVFFAVRNDVDDIRREDFPDPFRQDKYGTSVLSIQFFRGEENNILIINRYNHIVPKSNETFSRNLDNITEGLTESFEKEYGLNIINTIEDFEIPNYVKADDGKFYKYNYEINDKHYCFDNTIIDNGKVIKYDENKHLLVDYFLMDLENKSVSLYDNDIQEDFVNHLEDVDKIDIKNLDTAETKGDKEIIITKKDRSEIAIKTNKYNQIISLVGDDITKIGNDFLFKNKYLSKMSLYSVKNIGARCLSNNEVLSELILPSVKKIGKSFGVKNTKLHKIDLSSVKEIGNDFLYRNKILNELKAPLLKSIGDNFLISNEALVRLDLPLVKEIGNNFLFYNEILEDVRAPLLETVADGFLNYNQNIVDLSLPSLKRIGFNSLLYNTALKILNLPELQDIKEHTFGVNIFFKNMTAEEIRELSEEYKNKKLEGQVVNKNKDEKEYDEITI